MEPQRSRPGSNRVIKLESAGRGAIENAGALALRHTKATATKEIHGKRTSKYFQAEGKQFVYAGIERHERKKLVSADSS